MLHILICHCLHFQTIDKGEARELAFTNVLDKGYRCVLAAWRAGGQLLLQPFFAKSDRKFSSNETHWWVELLIEMALEAKNTFIRKIITTRQ
jgi:hypothetical protein